MFLALCALLALLDLVIPRKSHAPLEHWVGFYAFYGFGGCVILVLAAKEMRKLVMRTEEYYDPPGDLGSAPAGKGSHSADKEAPR